VTAHEGLAGTLVIRASLVSIRRCCYIAGADLQVLGHAP
jgi:hypothetical protein